MALVLALACDDPVPPKPVPFDVTLERDSLSVIPGAAGTYPATGRSYVDFRVVRRGYRGPIRITVASPPGIQTVTPGVLTTPQDTIDSGIGIDVPPGTAPREYIIALTFSAGDSGSVTARITLVVVPFSFRLGSPTLVVNRGSTNTVRVVFQKDPTMTPAVTVANIPAGITIALPTATAPYLDVTADATAAAGTSVLTVAASGGGISESRELRLTVQEPPAKRRISFRVCFHTYSGYSVSYGYGNEGEAWVPVSPTADGTFSFEATERVGFAVVFTYPGFYSTSVVARVIHASAAELETMVCASGQSGSKAFVVQASNADAPNVWLGRFHWRSGYTNARATDGVFDLVASTLNNVASGLEHRAIVRRSLDLAAGDTIKLDFASAESVVMDSAGYTVSAAGGDTVFVSTEAHTPTTVASLRTASGGGKYWALPAARLGSGDVQSVRVTAVSPPGSGNNSRGIVRYFDAASDQAFSLGPPVSAATRGAQLDSLFLPRQTEYPDLAGVSYARTTDFRGAHYTVELWLTKGYAGAAGDAWQFAVPDLGRAAGIPLLESSFSVSSAAATGPSLLFFGGAPATGTDMRWSIRNVSPFFAMGLPFPAR